MPQAEALGNLLLMQNMVVGLPDTVSIQNFVSRGLSFLPGVRSVSFAEPGGDERRPQSARFEYRLQVGPSDYGTLSIETEDPDGFREFDPYLKNFVFMVSIILEERRQRWENEESRRLLESRVLERTAQLQEALRTKDVLLQELFHRTRNGMQLIVSLLDIKAGGVDDPSAKVILLDMKNRIFAMSQAHELLYRRNDLSRIDAAEYLRSLVAAVERDYSDGSGRIRCEVSVPGGLILLIDLAVPLGIVIIELLSNAFKFAFPGDRKGSVRVELEPTDEGILALSVRDDGIGLPESFDFRKDGSTGMENVAVIIEGQLGGSISLEADPGLHWRAAFRSDIHLPRV